MIESICCQLEEKAASVINVAKRAKYANDADEAQLFESILLDEVEHIQNLTLALTKQITSKVGINEMEDVE